MIYYTKRNFFKLIFINIFILILLFLSYYFGFVYSFTDVGIESLWISNIELNWVVYLIVSLLINFIYLNKFYYNPLFLVLKQVTALLSGEKYEKIILNTKDEFEILAMFFNQATKNIESVSTYLKEGSRMASELAIASQIQKSVLPASLPSVPYLDFLAKTRAAEEVGGDSFDIEAHDDAYYFYIGDVTGHGAPAGLIMIMVNTLFDVYIKSVSDTKELAVKINSMLKDRVNATMFMTTSFFRWLPKSRQLFYTGCGHENIIIYRANEAVCEVFPAGGIALAMAEDISEIVSEKEITFNINDIIILYSDGITEAVNANGELFGLERLRHSILKNAYLSSSIAIFEAVSLDVQSFVGDTIQKDDMTLMLFKHEQTESPSRDDILTKWI